MTDNLEYIDRFYKGELPPGETEKFQQRIAEDSAFAEEVAFYFLTLQSLKNEAAVQAKNRFREIYEQQKSNNSIPQKPVRKLWPYWVAAAVLAGVILGWYFFFSTPSLSPQQLADSYIKKELEKLGVMMNSKEDSMQKAMNLYNEGKFNESLQWLEDMIKADTANFDAKKKAGIVCLRLQQYDKAIGYFEQLESYTSLYANPGKFYRALTLMKRNQPGDAVTAKQLLQEVVEKDIEGAEVAKEWLRWW
jgi:tetratricopeptide (TPR) repeat protein